MTFAGRLDRLHARAATSGMLLGNIFLLCMSYDRWRGLMPWTPPSGSTLAGAPAEVVE